MSPWVRIDENAMDHPKIGGLPDGAFRLWVQGLAYCQKYLTDGVIGDVALRGLRAYSPKRRTDLIETGLWDAATNGIQVHDYLEWNDSRETIIAARNDAKDRRQRWKDRRRNASQTETETRPETRSVLRGVECSEERSSEKRNVSSDFSEPFDSFEPELPPDSIDRRAGDFVERYKALHIRLRFGAHYVGKPGPDFEEAKLLAAVYDDDRLDKLAFVWLNTDLDFAQNGTRTIAKFRSQASWCEEQLIAWERKHGPLTVAVAS